MTIVQIAWLGARNYGDDIMAEALYFGLELYKNDKLRNLFYTVWSPDPPSPDENRKWIYPAIGNFKFLRRFWENKALWEADLLVIGGGSVLHSAHSSDWKTRGVNYFKRHKGKRAVGVSLSVGPFSSKSDEEACARFLQSLDACAFRDRVSYDFAKSLVLPYEPILAFDLAGIYTHMYSWLPRTPVQQISTVGLATRAPWKTDHKKAFHSYVELARRLADRYPKVLLFSFSAEPTQIDLKFCQEVRANVSAPNIEIVPYTGNTFAFTKELMRCNFIVSSKLHGAIISYLFNIPFAMISYQKKFEDFANDIKLPAEYRFKQLNFNPSEIIEHITPYQLDGRDHFISLARNNFDVFEEIP